MMKKLFSIISLLAMCLCSSAQECVIPLMVLVSDNPNEQAATVNTALETKLRQAVTKYGLEGGADYATFTLVGQMTENHKEVLSGTRPLVTLNMSLELFVGNNYTEEKFCSTEISLKGTGRNEAQAYKNCVSQLNGNNSEIQAFLKSAKAKIEMYYNTQVGNIVAQARQFAIQRQYDEALSLLSSVPTCCNQYPMVEEALLGMWQDYVNYDCARKIAMATAIWNATQDKKGASQAGAFLATIDPQASCYGDAKALAESIRVRIGDDWEFSKEILRSGIHLEEQRIAALRAVGVAYGQNQKSNTFNDHWIVR